MEKEFWKCEGENSKWGYITDDHRNAITLSVMEGWKKGRFKRTVKESSQFDTKKPEERESEFDNFDADYSYPT